MKNLIALIVLLTACTPSQEVYRPAKRMIVQADVVNVRSKPVPHSGEYKFDPLQETQLEKGEPVLVYERDGEWARVEAPEQLEFSHNNRWQGYPGWVPVSALTSDLTQIHSLQRSRLPDEELRKAILSKAELHLGDPYLWGGRSKRDSTKEAPATGVDCSGLVNWSFRQNGWFVPRDAHEQYMRAQPIDPSRLKPADLIFLAKKTNPKKMVHVAFYVGDEKILEAPSSGKKVQVSTFQERFGIPREKMTQEYELKDRIVFFGTFFSPSDE